MDINGYSQDELMAIGQRKVKLNLPMSATDINRSIPFEMSRAAASTIDGISEETLKRIGEHTYMDTPVMQPAHINAAPADRNNLPSVESELERLNQFLGIRTR